MPAPCRWRQGVYPDFCIFIFLNTKIKISLQPNRIAESRGFIFSFRKGRKTPSTTTTKHPPLSLEGWEEKTKKTRGKRERMLTNLLVLLFLSTLPVWEHWGKKTPSTFGVSITSSWWAAPYPAVFWFILKTKIAAPRPHQKPGLEVNIGYCKWQGFNTETVGGAEYHLEYVYTVISRILRRVVSSCTLEFG